MNRFSKLVATAAMALGLNLPANAADTAYDWNQTLQGSSDPIAADKLCGTYALPTIKTGMAALAIELDGKPSELTAVIRKTNSTTGTVVDTLVSPSTRPVKITSTTPLFVEIQCRTEQASYSPGRFRTVWNTAGKKLYVPSLPGNKIDIYDSITGSWIDGQAANASSGLATFAVQPGSYKIRATANDAEVWYGTNSIGKPRENATAVTISTTDKVAGITVSDRPTITGATIGITTKKLVITGTGFGDDTPGYVESFSDGKVSRSSPSNATSTNWTDTTIYATAGAAGVDRCVRVFSPLGGWSKECFKY